MRESSQTQDAYRVAQALMGEQRFAEAFKIYLSLASDGEPSAQVYVGWMYHKGLGTPRDSEQALSWFQRAASLGSAAGAFYCGRAAGTRDAWHEAIKWFKQAAQNDYGPALLWLGLVFLKGYGVPIDVSKAVTYLERAASTGNYYARRELALMMISAKLGLAKIPAGLVLLLTSALTAAMQYLTGQRDDKLIG
jgi:TPR repeat protein